MNRFLKLHKKLLREGLIDSVGDKCGLCCVEIEGVDLWFNSTFGNVKPSWRDLLELDGLNDTYWGSESVLRRVGVYTSLRQNLILLCWCLEEDSSFEIG